MALLTFKVAGTPMERVLFDYNLQKASHHTVSLIEARLLFLLEFFVRHWRMIYQSIGTTKFKA